MISRILALMLLAAGISAAQAQPYTTGNDIGGLIVWTPENEMQAHIAAQGHCAYYGKEAYLTSIYRQYGHYIGFTCVFPRGYVLRERGHALRVKG